MKATLKVATLAAGLIIGSMAEAGQAMAVAQQNALLQEHCVVCHSDATMNGGLSLEHFDAARPNPTVAAMVLSKVRDGGAMAAAAIPMPDQATQEALVSALTAQAVGADRWVTERTTDPTTHTPVLSVSIVREVPAPPHAKRYVGDKGSPDIFRLTLTCQADTRRGDVKLAWSPGVPASGSVVSASIDGGSPVTYQVDGSEKMFRGAVGTMGTGATLLLETTSLPQQTLTVNNLFQEGMIAFPFSDLSQEARRTLSTCFAEAGDQ